MNDLTWFKENDYIYSILKKENEKEDLESLRIVNELNNILSLIK
jgi:hypothetical protein